MSDIKVGFSGHDANLIHYVPSKWEKRWIKSIHWCKKIDKHWVYAIIIACSIYGLIIFVAIQDLNK